MKLSDFVANSGGNNGGGNVTEKFNREFITIDSTIFTNKELVLSHEPLPNTLRLSISHGIEQRDGVDFVLVDNIIAWHFLAMDLLIEVGDVLTIDYLWSI